MQRGVVSRRAVPVAAQQAPRSCVVQLAANQPGRALGGLQVGRIVQDLVRARKGRDRQAVPGDQDLVVEVRPRPSLALGEQKGARIGEDSLDLGGAAAEAPGDLLGAVGRKENVLSAVTLPSDAVSVLEPVGPFLPERALDPGAAPDVEDAFLLLLRPGRIGRALGVLGRIEPAFRPGHRAQDIPERLARDGGKIGPSCDLIRFQAGDGKLRLVVEHLLEMRHAPLAIDRIAVKPSAQVIVDAAGAHLRERLDRHVERLALAEPRVVTEQEGKHRRPRELRLQAEAAVLPVVALAEAVEARLQDRRIESDARACRRRGPSQDLGDLPPRPPDPLRVGTPEVAGAPDQVPEPIGRNVRPAEKRRQLRRQQERHRPAAAPRHGLERGHVDPVQVGALLTVDLDADERPVHERADLLALEDLALHDVTPVAGRVTDRQEDEPVFLAGPLERLRSPRIPVDRVEGMLEQVRALFAQQPVRFPAAPQLFGDEAGGGVGGSRLLRGLGP